MNVIWILFRREFVSYFITPIAYVFIVFFLGLLGAMTFFLGGFFDRGQADLAPFFAFHTWLYLLLIPAISMRLWSEERQTGTIELLLTLPVSATQAVIAKFLAAWAFAAIAVAPAALAQQTDGAKKAESPKAPAARKGRKGGKKGGRRGPQALRELGGHPDDGAGPRHRTPR